ncbi:putative olfactory receptor 13C6 [Pelobates fuscus]|uniref:putative olfactory receptor 13C6 n=1 Tax=Pelobates fuscus TaxID=191477 RepID=UPI002FE4F149
MENQTTTSGFILVGLTNVTYLQPLCFFVFLVMYAITLSGNIILIVVVRINLRLQTPMYFFLSNLSFIDICFSSTIVPKILINTLSQDKSISFLGCAAQMYFSLCLGATECFLLTVMAFDRYAAICKPLHYNVIMNKKLCFSLAAGSWAAGFINAFIQVPLTFKLPYCRSHHINHFFFFSTCASHLTVVALYYGTIMSMYLRPPSVYIHETDKTISILYTTVTPMLNPIIYSIRNEDSLLSDQTIQAQIIDQLLVGPPDCI